MSQEDRLLTEKEIRTIPFYKITPQDALPYELAKAQDTKSYAQALKDVGEWKEGKEIAFCNECEMLYVEPEYIKALKRGEMPKEIE